jgi:hypothetical protein
MRHRRPQAIQHAGISEEREPLSVWRVEVPLPSGRNKCILFRTRERAALFVAALDRGRENGVPRGSKPTITQQVQPSSTAMPMAAEPRAASAQRELARGDQVP